MKNLISLFSPKTVAVIGASTKKGSIGNIVFANILLSGYTGVVYPVNPNAKSVLGVKSFPSVLAIPDEIDLAVIIVPAPIVKNVLEDCGKKGVKSVIVISAGFKEIGEKGASLEEEIKKIAKEYNIPLLGPNCFGVINASPKVRLNTTFGRVMPEAGNIAFVTQSGAVGATALELATAYKVGFSIFVSFGNKADINENDLLLYLKEDEDTKVILLYLEDLTSPQEFLKITREITTDYQKPILAIKAGRTEAGQKAASSHTGALAGSDEIYNAFLEQCGILRVEKIEDLFNYAKAFASQPLPKGKRVGIITNAGGIGVMAADAAALKGLEVTKFTKETEEKLKRFLPPQANISNPLDVIGDADEERYINCLKALLEDENVDAVICNWTPSIMAETKNIAKRISEIALHYQKPIFASLLTLSHPQEIIEILWESKIPYYSFPEEGVSALALMVKFKEWTERPLTEVKIFEDVQREKVKEIIAKYKDKKFLLEPDGYEILKSYNIPVMPYFVVNSLEECLAAAKKLTYPVVLKVISFDVLHKTEVGGVFTDIENEEELKEKYQILINNMKKRNYKVEGILCQKMAEIGVETIIGAKKDKVFGQVVMFGLGGIYVEVFKDVAFRVCPIRELSAYHMISETKGYQILNGIRKGKKYSIDKIAEVLMRLSQLVCEFDNFSEVDINPFIVYEENKGGYACDARFILY
jgi:acetyltransferase